MPTLHKFNTLAQAIGLDYHAGAILALALGVLAAAAFATFATRKL